MYDFEKAFVLMDDWNQRWYNVDNLSLYKSKVYEGLISTKSLTSNLIASNFTLWGYRVNLSNKPEKVWSVNLIYTSTKFEESKELYSDDGNRTIISIDGKNWIYAVGEIEAMKSAKEEKAKLEAKQRREAEERRKQEEALEEERQHKLAVATDFNILIEKFRSGVDMYYEDWGTPIKKTSEIAIYEFKNPLNSKHHSVRITVKRVGDLSKSLVKKVAKLEKKKYYANLAFDSGIFDIECVLIYGARKIKYKPYTKLKDAYLKVMSAYNWEIAVIDNETGSATKITDAKLTIMMGRTPMDRTIGRQENKNLL
jgi:hypothetical protein